MPECEAMIVTSLRIRMYNVGFGDCFLLTIPTDDGDRTMLLDCGKHMSSKTGHPIREAAEDVVETVRRKGKSRIDVVVATHRHFDHVSGFDLNLWRDVEVGEVWMPWTEEPGNPAAERIRRSQKRLAVALCRRFGANTAVGRLAFNSLSNEGAMSRLRSGFVGMPPVRYLPEQNIGVQTFTTDLLPGVNVHALGPSHDPDVIALMDPPAGKYFPIEGDVDREALLSVGAAARKAGSKVTFPQLFDDAFRLDPPEFKKSYPDIARRADTGAIDKRSQFDMMAAASSLEEAINGTSLVFALDFGHVCVLLAGDAEWGTWSVSLDDPIARALLSRTRAYKVSHHGSFNGTPREFVDELLPKDAISLVSLGTDIWPSIPRKSLLDSLDDGPRRLLRSDELPSSGADLSHQDDLWVELSISVA
jgi:beta-lactamase superfamily II metal-dependent hydrolase